MFILEWAEATLRGIQTQGAMSIVAANDPKGIRWVGRTVKEGRLCFNRYSVGN